MEKRNVQGQTDKGVKPKKQIVHKPNTMAHIENTVTDLRHTKQIENSCEADTGNTDGEQQLTVCTVGDAYKTKSA